MTHTRMMDDQFFSQCIIRDECSRLDSIHRAIGQWEDIATAAWHASQPQSTAMDAVQAHWAAEHFNDQAYTIYITKQSMLGSLAVTIASSVENFFGTLCKDRKIELPDRPGWGVKRQKIEDNLGVRCDDLSGIEQVTRVRMMGNCFKHNDGKKNSEFVEKYGGNEGDEIDFNCEDWSALIDAIRQFLFELVSHTGKKDSK